MNAAEHAIPTMSVDDIKKNLTAGEKLEMNEVKLSLKRVSKKKKDAWSRHATPSTYNPSTIAFLLSNSRQSLNQSLTLSLPSYFWMHKSPMQSYYYESIGNWVAEGRWVWSVSCSAIAGAAVIPHCFWIAEEAKPIAFEAVHASKGDQPKGTSAHLW